MVVQVVVVVDGETGLDRRFYLARLPLASQQEHYDLNFTGGLFSTTRLVVSTHDNGGVATLGIDSAEGRSEEAEGASFSARVRELMEAANARAREEGRALPFPELSAE